MAGRKSKNKGANGEREVADMMYSATGMDVKRNLEQTRSGGYDLIGIPGLAVEVKRQERLAVNTWWKQTLSQAGEDEIPILAYRQNKKPWIFLIGHDKQELTEYAFRVWLKTYVQEL